MNKEKVRHWAEPRQILQAAIEKKAPALMTYLSRGKWHIAKVFLTDLVDDRLYVEVVHSGEKPHPISVCVHQPLGISFKYEHGKFIFDTTVVALEPSRDQAGGGTIVLVMPDQVEVVQRRSYFRVQVPESLKVKAMLWHRSRSEAQDDPAWQQVRVSLMQRRRRYTEYEPKNYCQGRLVDISAGGVQIVVPRRLETNTDIDRHAAAVAEQGFKKGQFVGVRFTPVPYETPLMFNAQIRNILPASSHCGGEWAVWTATDREKLCLGLQIVGLEASQEGRQVLSRLVGIVERYFKMNQTGARVRDML